MDMLVGGPAGFGFFGGVGLRFGGAARASTGTASVPQGPSLSDFALSVGRLARSFHDLELGARRRVLDVQVGARVSSAGSLSISPSGSPTTLGSTEELNTTSTSYGPHQPSFTGSSSSAPTLTGTYDGDQGDDTLTFAVTLGGVVGLTPVSIEVRDGQDAVIDQIDMLFEPAGTSFALSNGLSVRFASGSIAGGDAFTVDVSSSVATSVAPDNPFDGTLDQSPDFDPGLSVQAGSFQVNGTSISVGASDTLRDVLDRITASSAGVTAAYVAETDSVVLTQQTAGSASTIALSNDTSGLLDALKLSGAAPVLGRDDQGSQPIAQVGALAGIQSGTFVVNGTSLSVDVQVDSLRDVLDRITANVEGVQASLDPSGAVRISSTGSTGLGFSDGSSGLFTALGIAEGNFAPRRSPGSVRFDDERALRDSLADFVRAFDEVFDDAIVGPGSAVAGDSRSRLESAVKSAFGAQLGTVVRDAASSGLGLDFAQRPDGRLRLVADGAALSRALSQDPDELTEFLFAPSAPDRSGGLLARIETALDGIAERLAPFLPAGATTGLVVDRYG